MISRVPSTFSASEAAITSPLRTPIKISRVPTTISSASKKFMIKPFTAPSTSWD
ncbi:hypothetical protein D3C78_1928000 [compost metagenome]